MHVFRRFFQLIYCLYAFILFFTGMFIIFPFVLFAGLFLDRIKGGNIAYSLCRLWADFVLLLIGIFHRNIYEAPHNRKVPYIFVSNHNSYMDIPEMMKAIRRQPVRILAKAELGKMPVFGLIYKTAVVAVDRTSPESRIKSIKILKSYLKNLHTI